MKPGLSSSTDFPFRDAAIRLPVYKVNPFPLKSKQKFIFFRGREKRRKPL